MKPRPSILVLPRVSLYRKLFSASTDALLRSLGDVCFNETEQEWTGQQLAKYLPQADVVITGWGSARLTDELLDAAPKLKLVAHSAGSVKFLFDEKVFSRGIQVSTSGNAMVRPVSELAVMLCLLMLRPIYKLDAAMRQGGDWANLKVVGVGDDLSTKTVGVVGAGQIGKRVIHLLRAWDLQVNVFDPFFTPEQAKAMGVRRCDTLNELMSGSNVVTLHAPNLPETQRMIGKAQLSAMVDGSVLINTARASLVDNEALAEELKAGRLQAAVDVFDQEPLPLDSPWRSMPNCLITPHIASYTRQAFFRQGEISVQETERFVTGKPLMYPVTKDTYKFSA